MSSHRHQIISDFLEYIQNVRRYSIHTFRSYQHDLDEYLAFCRDFDPEHEFTELDQTAIQAFLQHLSRKGLSAKTLARRLASIKSLYKYMLKNKLVRVNITQPVKTPKIKNCINGGISRSQKPKIRYLLF